MTQRLPRSKTKKMSASDNNKLNSPDRFLKKLGKKTQKTKNQKKNPQHQHRIQNHAKIMQKLGKNRVKSTKKSKLVAQQLLRTQTRQGAQIPFTQRHQAVSQRGSRGR